MDSRRVFKVTLSLSWKRVGAYDDSPNSGLLSMTVFTIDRDAALSLAMSSIIRTRAEVEVQYFEVEDRGSYEDWMKQVYPTLETKT